MKAVFALFFLLLPVVALAGRSHPESFYRDAWAAKHNGKTEVSLPDGTRADVVTESHAVEVDFADKWAEAVGQCLFYGLQTNKKAGIVLILEEKRDYRFAVRLGSIIHHYGLKIDVFLVGAGAPVE